LSHESGIFLRRHFIHFYAFLFPVQKFLKRSVMKKIYATILCGAFALCSNNINAQPANDDCANAILVSTIPYNDLTTDYTNANTSGATRSTPDPSCITSSDNNDDIWYKFVASAETELLRVHSAVTGSIYTTFGVALYDGCGGTELMCNNQLGTFYTNEMLGGLTPGNTYFLRFWSLHNFTSMTFSFAVMDIDPISPSNEAVTATPLTINNAGAKCIAPQFFTTNGATRSSPNPSCNSDNDDDVWFQFTHPAKAVFIYVEEGALISSSSYPNMGMEIIDVTAGITASCNPSSVVGSSTLFSGAPGHIYRMRLWTIGTSDRAVFSLCMQTGFGDTALNNTCATATLLTVGAGACTNAVTGNLFNSDITASLNSNPSCTVNTTLKNDVWYKAVVPASGNLVVQTSATNSAVNDLVMLAYTDNCSTFTQLACDEDGNTAAFPSANHARISLTGRTPGDTILFRVLPRNGNNLGQFSICAFDETVAALPAISISNVSKKEGNSGTKQFDFTVSLDKPSSDTVTVKYETVDNTAVAPGDYAAVSKTKIKFKPGDTTKIVSITVNGDIDPESDEIFKVKLSSPVNAIIADDIGKGTIKDDDGPQAQVASDANASKIDDAMPGIYPNPARDKLNILLPVENAYSITIMNMAGAVMKQLKAGPNEKLISVDVKDLANGIYMIKFQSATKSASLKFMKD